GDRLPGDVVGYQSGDESPFHRLPPHLFIQPAIELHWPDRSEQSIVRVTAQWLQRVVWKHRGNDEYRPATVFMRDGRAIAFRSLRWADGAITLLLEKGIEIVSIGEIAELHLPRQGGWNAYYEQLAALTPTCEARLMQLETADGLRATTSTERF